jgi:hypothetical protein
MPKNLLILKFLYGRDRPSGFLASKELRRAERKLAGQDKFLPALPRPPAGPYAVEKLLPAKFAKIKSRQDALQATFSTWVDIFSPPIFRCFEENGLFQQPRLLTTVTSGLLVVREESQRLSASDFPEADFGPGITSGLSVMQQVSVRQDARHYELGRG